MSGWTRAAAKALQALVFLLLLAPLPARAASVADTMALCRNAALQAADRHGVPRAVMLAITLVETRTRRGGSAGPWPWTVNVAGKGDWFDSRAAALLHAQGALAKGQKSFDVGCFQLNYRWHSKHFASIDQMFEPGPSGDYAARFLKTLHAETGDWIRASGLYHSRTPVHAKRYRKLVARAVAAMGGKLPAATAVAAAAARPSGGPPPQRVFRVAGTRLVAAETTGNVRVPRPAPAGGVSLVIVRRSNGGLIRQTRRRGGG